VLFLRRLSILLSENCFGSEDILFEEVLLDELFQIPSEGPTMVDLVPFAVMVATVFFRPEKQGIVLNWSRASYPWLVFDGIENLVDWELQWCVAFHRSVNLGWIW